MYQEKGWSRTSFWWKSVRFLIWPFDKLEPFPSKSTQAFHTTSCTHLDSTEPSNSRVFRYNLHLPLYPIWSFKLYINLYKLDEAFEHLIPKYQKCKKEALRKRSWKFVMITRYALRYPIKNFVQWKVQEDVFWGLV